MTADWITATDLAAEHGCTERDVVAAAALTGIANSKVHARWSGRRLSMTRAAAAVVVRSLGSPDGITRAAK
jgi:hypothetical protein